MDNRVIKDGDHYVSIREENGEEISRVQFLPVIESDTGLDSIRREYLNAILVQIDSGEEKDISKDDVLELEKIWFPESQELEECV